MDWDSTSYTDAPHCIRRFDTNLTVADPTGEVHSDGQIWSQALWEIRQGYVALGLSTARLGHHADRQSQFAYAPDTSFSAAAKATYATALKRDGAAAARRSRRFAARGITFWVAPGRTRPAHGGGARARWASSSASRSRTASARSGSTGRR